MRDETLADIASHPPKKQADLAKVRGLSAAWKDNDIGKRMMKIDRRCRPAAQIGNAREDEARARRWAKKAR